MKSIVKYVFIIVALAGFVFISSCEEDDNAKPWGNELIYMPQAALFSGGVNNDYPVPAPSGYFGQNYAIDKTSSSPDTLVNVFLGVYRSGMESLESYTVDVKANNDTIAKAQAGGLYSTGVLLDASAYTLPPKITVPGGQREASFNLTISKAKLRGDAKYANKKLLLAVGIDNPTKYELNKKLSTTIVVISNWESLK